MRSHLQLIGGEWIGAAGGGLRPLVNPATEEVIEDMPFGGADDVTKAIDAASEALAAWSEATAYERGAILEKAAALLIERAEEYSVPTTEESGKPLEQSKAEWLSAPNYLLTASEEAKRLGGRWIPARLKKRRIDVTYRPIGVVGVITAWNFPVYNPNRAVSSALAAGCTVVVRPSAYTPRSAMLYAAALHDAGAPPGVINVVNGDADAMGRRLLSDVRVRKVAFTGSSAVGRSLIEASGQHVTRLALELGGNAPVIVFPDVEDLDRVASSGVTAKLRNCGQACIAPQRYYVHSSIIEEFTSKVAKHFEQQKVGNGLDPEVTVGPLINAKQRGWVAGLVEKSADAGARVRTGGDSVSGPGYFYQPTVLDQVPPDAPILTEEVFGPVMPIVPFDTTEEALAMANASEYGLAGFVCTGNLRTALRVSEQLEYGLVGINDWYPVSAEAPFGGMRQSGIGRESGYEGVHEYVEAKARFFGGIE